MELHFSEIENIKGVIFNTKQQTLTAFKKMLSEEQNFKFNEFNTFKKLNDKKNKIFKDLKLSFLHSLSDEQAVMYETLDRVNKSYKTILKIETTLAINNLLKNEI